jgi:hypothetical protein
MSVILLGFFGPLAARAVSCFAGPGAAGITALPIDPEKPADRRIDSVFDLPSWRLITG